MEMIIIIIGVAAVIIFGVFALFSSFYKKVDQGYAMIVNTLRREPDVTFTGRLVIPVIHRREIMNISLKTIEIDRRGKDGLICKDNIRADITVAFFVRVNKTKEDVLKVAQAIGCDRASDHATLEELFNSKFSEALKTVGKRMDFVELYQERDKFRDDIIKVIGEDLNGYVLEDAAIDYLEQTPVGQLDKNNILDAQGIRKITELTAVEHVRTNELERDEQMKIKKKDVETEETIFELERQRADAEAKQQREIASVRARERAEQEKVESEELLKSEHARIKTEQEVAVAEENKNREIEVANYNRQRVIAAESEQVQRTRDLEAVARERAVELERIEKEKALEHERKLIADVIRERVVVDKTVAEEQEKIKTVEVVADADRKRQAKVITAEAEAQEELIKRVKAAEAQEQQAKHMAQEELIMADAELHAAEKRAEAKKREAEGVEAVEAAPGLARARVQEAEADALEKQGMADAKVLQEKLLAQADGDEKLGLAQARIKQADAEASERMAAAEAKGLQDKLQAQAQGDESVGLAQARVKQADAEATERMAAAEAKQVELRYAAEAKGLREKFEAMQTMDDQVRDHEEFRMQLDYGHEQRMKGITANVEIAQEQARILANALQDANIDIVGGEGDYFERFVRALAVGKSIDGVLDKSQTVGAAYKAHLEQGGNVIEDLRGLVAGLGSGSESLQNLSVAAFVNKLMAEGSEEQKSILHNLLDALKKS